MIPIVKALDWLGQHRDGVILAGSMVYALGYLFWCFSAWKYRLGWLPALRFNYFVAGSICTLALLLVYGATKVPGLGPLLRVAIHRLTVGWQFVLVVCWCVGWGVLVWCMTRSSFKRWFKDLAPATQRVAGLLFFCFCSFVTLTLLTTSWGTGGSLSLLAKVEKCVAIVVIALVLPVEAFRLFGELPEEFGGFCVRQVRLEMNRNDVSAWTLKDLFPDLNGAEQKTIRSTTLLLYPSLDNYFRVRLENSQDTTYQIPKDKVRVLHQGLRSAPYAIARQERSDK